MSSRLMSLIAGLGHRTETYSIDEAFADPVSKWAHQLREKSGWQKAVVALANKNAHILWAVFVRGRAFDAHHVSVKPGAAMTVPGAAAG